MLLSVHAPTISPSAVATVRVIHVLEGSYLPGGTKFLDFSADLGGGIPHDCPPISHYRIIIRDAAWLRRLDVEAGARLSPRALLALLSTEVDEPVDASPARAARVTVAGIILHDGWGETG